MCVPETTSTVPTVGRDTGNTQEGARMNAEPQPRAPSITWHTPPSFTYSLPTHLPVSLGPMLPSLTWLRPSLVLPHPHPSPSSSPGPALNPCPSSSRGPPLSPNPTSYLNRSFFSHGPALSQPRLFPTWLCPFQAPPPSRLIPPSPSPASFLHGPAHSKPHLLLVWPRPLHSPLPPPHLTLSSLTFVRAPAERQLALALPVEAALKFRTAGRARDHVGLQPRAASGFLRPQSPTPSSGPVAPNPRIRRER